MKSTCLLVAILVVSGRVSSHYVDVVTPSTLRNFNRTVGAQGNLRLLAVLALLNNGWQQRAGHWYRMFDRELDWVSAENWCRSLGAHLVSIGDPSENDFVRDIRKHNNVWIGLNKLAAADGVYKWSDDTAASFLNWDSTQPNQPLVDCAYMAYSMEARDGTWYDQSCQGSQPLYFVCEIDNV